ncbi:Cro/CI family transcriptional regulator [Achromobacter insuavis]|uniref:Cro/CI family transcriptional regulator n=1 Tax=Achromobacter insuavis TaxID=1287735 RepID=UPI0015D1FEDD|nr:Cro/CI family transcriptional regulator [Achromobacter insuavis]
MDHRHPDNQIIDAFGGTVALAKVCECEPQAVSQWRRSGIPKARRQYLRALRPDLFASAKPQEAAHAIT